MNRCTLCTTGVNERVKRHRVGIGRISMIVYTWKINHVSDDISLFVDRVIHFMWFLLEIICCKHFFLQFLFFHAANLLIDKPNQQIRVHFSVHMPIDFNRGVHTKK